MLKQITVTRTARFCDICQKEEDKHNYCVVEPKVITQDGITLTDVDVCYECIVYSFTKCDQCGALVGADFFVTNYGEDEENGFTYCVNCIDRLIESLEDSVVRFKYARNHMESKLAD